MIFKIVKISSGGAIEKYWFYYVSESTSHLTSSVPRPLNPCHLWMKLWFSDKHFISKFLQFKKISELLRKWLYFWSSQFSKYKFTWLNKGPCPHRWNYSQVFQTKEMINHIIFMGYHAKNCSNEELGIWFWEKNLFPKHTMWHLCKLSFEAPVQKYWIPIALPVTETWDGYPHNFRLC